MSHDYKEGDVIVHTWGYDQTNATFYQVVRVTTSSVWIKKLNTNKTYDGESMTGTATPKKDDFAHPEQPPLRRKPYYFNYSGGEWLVTINSYTAGAEHWNGTPVHTSHYA
jgi:hypothetical protein